jgi:hypothetical protein
MKLSKYLNLVLLTTIVSSCGGGGDTTTAGIGGTGITTSGTVDGFGSIFVNGVEYETDTASIVLDSETALESALRLGMVVTVIGTVNSDGITGTANSVEFDDEVQGPISAISTDADGTSQTLTVLDQAILADQTSTVFDNVTFGSLAINDLVEVSGFFDSSSILHATRIEKKEPFVAGVSEVEIKGLVNGLTATQFTLNSFTVDFDDPDLSDVSGGVLTEDLKVEVKGTLSGNTITASQIEDEDDLFDENEENVSLEGLITDFVDASDFKVAEQQVNALNAELEPVNLQLEDGLQVEVKGAIVNGVLMAHEVEARSGEVKLAATVQSVNIVNGTGTITLAFAAGSVSFAINNQTELGDETNTFDPIAWTDISTGNFLEVKALLNGTQIVATEVRLKNPSDEVVQGPVESFVSGNEVTLLGLTFMTIGADFEDAIDQPIDSGIFYTQLSLGRVVKIQDNLLPTPDGIANEVEFED